MTRHERLREHLAALELRRGARRPEEALTAASEQVGDPAIERELRADNGEIDAFARGEVAKAPPYRQRRSRRFERVLAMPALPGAQTTPTRARSELSFQASACSRAPLPTTRTFTAANSNE